MKTTEFTDRILNMLIQIVKVLKAIKAKIISAFYEYHGTSFRTSKYSSFMCYLTKFNPALFMKQLMSHCCPSYQLSLGIKAIVVFPDKKAGPDKVSVSDVNLNPSLFTASQTLQL